MLNPVDSAASSALRPQPPKAATPLAEPPATASRDSLRLSRPNLAANQVVKPLHSDGWKDLGEVVTVMVASPIASLVGAGIGFLVGGPAGAAIGAAIGGSAPGTAFAAKNLAHHLGHVARKEDTGNGFNLKLAGKLMIIPGTTLAGAGLGFALGGPVGAAIGAALGSVALPLGGFISAGIQKLLGRKPEPENAA